MRKRRKFSPEFKARVVIEVLTGVKTSAEVAREYGVKSQLLSKWKATFLENAASLFDRETHSVDDQVRIAELERLAGRQALEIEILHLPWRAVPGKKASDILRAHRDKNEK